jgi:hypothetical protein
VQFDIEPFRDAFTCGFKTTFWQSAADSAGEYVRWFKTYALRYIIYQECGSPSRLQMKEKKFQFTKITRNTEHDQDIARFRQLFPKVIQKKNPGQTPPQNPVPRAHEELQRLVIMINNRGPLPTRQQIAAILSGFGIGKFDYPTPHEFHVGRNFIKISLLKGTATKFKNYHRKCAAENQPLRIGFSSFSIENSEPGYYGQ